MSIYTKTGDGGQTSLATGQRIDKDDMRLEAYGTADELNSFVGLLRSKLTTPVAEDSQLEWIQNKLFNLGAALAEAEGEWIVTGDVQQIEHWIDVIQQDIPPQHKFVLPGGNEVISLCHICRTITRRLERNMVRVMSNGDEKKDWGVLLRFVNRLSDFWFVFAQKCGKNAGIELFFWKK
ncbi:MAG: cob(I)yrinic acid a,c-diamide adenosyltransferase [Paludibacteraceae bacterium]|nr:cob(I)yrinic acid a,c-diamide adenosyltransferase [Paludibacteraceae bacterium]